MENTSEDEAVIIRNLKDSAALLPRIAALRQVLRQLRMALRQERENLSKEINTIKWLEVGKMKKKFILEDDSKPFAKVDFRRNNRGNDGQSSKYPLEVLHFRNGNGDSCTTGNCGSLLDSKIYQRRVDRLKEELDSFERSCRSMSILSMSKFYKEKIHDLERDCCAGLNRVKDGFVESLQAFENTLDFIRSERSSKRTSNADGYRNDESFVIGRRKEKNLDGGARQRAKWQTLSSNVEKQSSLCRTKSLIIENRHHGLWLAQICSQRFSDSAICNDAMYRASRFHLERPHHIVGILEPSNDLRFSTNFTAVFPIVGKRTPILTL
ncbi:uncharacterized protein LOC122631112 [Vespula pensylvanica]|uniref:uncharacterized protein LOC122631112 n=1 Tax=Vespula pensylvanica TaxID=30213 RepID=UPI001CBA1DAE|nr:uncharacterized protein LOC122631112 [Vespula pensylvanica]